MRNYYMFLKKKYDEYTIIHAIPMNIISTNEHQLKNTTCRISLYINTYMLLYT
ncbi:hypothetical protein PFUGPA_03223 [Plasmodium falciparum Palo Alto/Uganda]|uniref:Uncharacterized protein n=2 Tax=Plasmodium falciparum TaxID=5833 RepID=W4IZ49_PLAFP|nr:hypothetical protein PFUGPA_03223 [Plasmodium falciparum Palo Alto/Uganda]